MTLARDLAAVYTAATGAAPSAALADEVAVVLHQNYFAEDMVMPPYFSDGFRYLARRELSPGWTTVAPGEHGLVYILGELAPLVPGAVFHYEGIRNEFAVPKLGLALVVESSASGERWAVVPMEPASAAASAPLIVLDTFSPDADQVRRWAYDPAIRFTQQDESDAIEHDAYLAQLAELVTDPACVKRLTILAVLDQLVVAGLRRAGVTGLDSIAAVRAPATARGAAGLPVPEPTLHWLAGLARLEAYVHASGPVSPNTAHDIAQLLLAGPRRPALVVSDAIRDGWSEHVAEAPLQRPVEVLYVHTMTGTLHWANAPLSVEAQAQLAVSTARLGQGEQ